jgi:uncharacterized protein (TIGR02611 family)
MTRVPDKGLRTARKTIIGVVGGTLVVAGIALIVLPGPAMVLIPIGLAILGTEFVWARKLMRKVKRMISDAGENLPRDESHRKKP